MFHSRRSTAFLAAASLFAFGAARAALPRFPQPYGDRVVFVADGSIWSVAKSGGSAQRLTSAAGQDLFPRASPDGRWIAYTEASKAGTDVWVIPANGGSARRLTFHPTTESGTGGRHGPDNMVVTWTPDSKSVVYLSKQKQWNTWIQNMYAVPVDGGLPTALPIDSAVGLATYGPDGHSIAYNRIFRNFRTWKRYNGGLAQQVFTYDFETKQLAQVTDWSGTNTSPMWWGRRIYFLSDRDANRRANIWVYDLDTKQTRQVTHFTDLDIDFPGLGGDAIAFQQGGKLYTLDLPSEKLSEVDVHVGDDNARTRPRIVAVKDNIRDSDIAQQVDYALAPNGKRTLFSARGDVFSVPTEDGATRDLTGTQGVDEDHPAWSPDGRTVAYTTDVGGEQQIAVRPAEGGVERVLTAFKSGYLYGPIFSPDGQTLTFSDSAHRLWLVGVDKSGTPRQIAQDTFGEIHDQAFSPDGRWLAYSVSADVRRRDLYLFEISTGKTSKLGDSSSTDFNPMWSPDGKYLYFISNRHENPVPSDAEFDFAIVKSLGLYAIPLARDTVSPMAPRSDEADSGPEAAGGPGLPRDAAGRAGHGAASDDKGAKGEKAKPSPDRTGPIAPIRIDLDGLMSRAVALPIEPGNIAEADARGDRLIYLTQPLSLIEGPLNGEKSALHVFDFKTRKDAAIAQDVDSYSLALNGQRVLLKRKSDYVVVDTKADAEKDSDATKKLNLDRMRVLADPVQEWAEMFDNAWRLERDFFFSPVLLLLDGNLVIIDASRSFCEAFEIDLAEMRGATLTQLGSGEWRRPRLQELLVATASDSSGKGACEVELRRPGRSDRQLIVHAERLAYHDLPEIRIMVAISDVTQLRADRQAVAETHERHRVLLHEVRHRVANSLQIVASILLQDARKAHSEEAKSSLADAHNRVMSIAALERQLTDLTADGVEVRTYFTTLCTSISASMVGDRERIAILVTGPGGVVDARLSLSLGLIVTELVINALKHAFPNERHGAITIECAFPGPNWVLAVADNGVGVPTDQRDTRVGLGTSIVNALVRQVGATVSVEAASPGTRVSISRTAIALVDETRISDVSADRSIA